MLTIPKAFYQRMLAHARREDPNECCGILAGRDGTVTQLYEMQNADSSPYSYTMDSIEMLHTYRAIEDQGLEVMAIYHSHTHSQAYPSPTDIRQATFPDACYIIVSLASKAHPIARAFRIVAGQVTEEKLTVS